MWGRSMIELRSQGPTSPEWGFFISFIFISMQERPEGRILVTGSAGVIGRNLVPALAECYGRDRIVATFHQTTPPPEVLASAETVLPLDIQDTARFKDLIERHEVKEVLHFAALLSIAMGNDPEMGRHVNLESTLRLLEVLGEKRCRLLFASSMAVHGVPAALQENPRPVSENEFLENPITDYGKTKRLIEEALEKSKIQSVALRYPGVNAPGKLGDGSTECLAEMMVAPAKGEIVHACPVPSGQGVSMMDVRDVVSCTITALDALRNGGLTQAVYGVAGYSGTPRQVEEALRGRYPEFQATYGTLHTQKAANLFSWPTHLDDTVFRRDTGWRAQYSLQDTIESLQAWAVAHSGK